MVFLRYLMAGALGVGLLTGCQSNSPSATTETPVAVQTIEDGEAETAVETESEAGSEESEEVVQALEEVSGPALDPDPALEPRVPELLEGMSSNHFTVEQRKEPDNAKVFVYIAGTQEDPQVISAALNAMKLAYQSHKLPYDQRYVTVAHHFLKNADPKLKRGALEACSPVLGEEQGAELRETLLLLAAHSPDPGIRSEALRVTENLLRVSANDEEVLAVVSQGLDSEHPHLLVRSLDILERRADKSSSAEETRAKILAHTEHQDPAVQGMALSALVKTTDKQTPQETISLLEEKLDSESPFVRARAVQGLGDLRSVESVPKMLALLDDSADHTTVVKFSFSDGSESQMNLGPVHKRVDRVTLGALRTLSSRMTEQLTFDAINRKTQDEDITKAVAQAKEWAETAQPK